MDPYLVEERIAEKRAKENCNMCGFVADTQYGIPSSCACGGRIVDEVLENHHFDTHPGKRFFTYTSYKDDGWHYRQPWVFGVEEEIWKLTKRVEEAEKETCVVQDLNHEIKELKEQVRILTMRVDDLEKLCFD